MKKVIKREIYGAARVGYSGKYEVYVNTDDAGKLPHCHIRDKADWSLFHSCIRLDTAEYFLHAGKESTLNASQRKQFQQFMEGPVTLSKYVGKFDNNWELACFLWDINNSDVVIPEDTEMPNYLTLR